MLVPKTPKLNSAAPPCRSSRASAAPIRTRGPATISRSTRTCLTCSRYKSPGLFAVMSPRSKPSIASKHETHFDPLRRLHPRQWARGCHARRNSSQRRGACGPFRLLLDRGIDALNSKRPTSLPSLRRRLNLALGCLTSPTAAAPGSAGGVGTAHGGAAVAAAAPASMAAPSTTRTRTLNPMSPALMTWTSGGTLNEQLLTGEWNRVD